MSTLDDLIEAFSDAVIRRATMDGDVRANRVAEDAARKALIKGIFDAIEAETGPSAARDVAERLGVKR